jgi:hypothetical protein
MRVLNAAEMRTIAGGDHTVTTTITGSDGRAYTVHRTYNNSGELISMTVHPAGGPCNEAL